MADPKSGNTTSEHGLAKLAIVIGAVLQLGAAIPEIVPSLEGNVWVQVAMLALGTIAQVLSVLGYNAGRVRLKEASASVEHARLANGGAPASPSVGGLSVVPNEDGSGVTIKPDGSGQPPATS